MNWSSVHDVISKVSFHNLSSNSNGIRYISEDLIEQKRLCIRDGFKKSKWKFKMAFAMKGGGVSRGSRVPFTYFEK